ncbi:allantoinase [Peribacillus sp. Hz7]|uniref:allantoinase n=1 Tax=Peribacillus sp. Hz7 TaxID=3344873 RepID=UPI0035CAA22C
METYDLIIRDGLVVLPTEVKRTNIAVKDGVIVEIADHLVGEAAAEWRADGQYVFPGMIDVHVHFSEPGRAHWEGFETGSQMMAAGGCTTYFDMPLNGIPSTVHKEALLEKADMAARKSSIDFGLWGGLVPGNIADLRELAESGVVGFKAFLSASGNEEFERVDDLTLLNGMKTIASLGKVLALHAESEAITSWLQAEKVQAGLISAKDYAAARPVLAEVEAVERALTYAELTGCPLHFVHISSAAAVEKIEQAKKRGLNVTVETCPHYLLFSDEAVVEKGPVAKCAPPLRSQSEQEKLIELFKEGKFDMISSDHSPCPYELKDPAVHSFFEAWGGISGGQFSLLSVIQLAIEHDIPFFKIAEVTAAAPAKRFGLSATKGSIQVGMDADFAIVSLKEPFMVTEDRFFAKHKQTIYNGHTFPCTVVATMNRGRVVYHRGGFSKYKGKWMKNKRKEEPAIIFK